MKIKFTLFVTSLLLMISNISFPANIIFLSPVNDDVVLLYFREGEKNTSESPGYTAAGCSDIWNTGILDAATAKNTVTYTITSTDDENYTNAVNPESIGYKSKKEAGFSTYWVYLKLPSALKEGDSYTIGWGSLASNKSSETFIFNTKNLRSEAVHVNEVGYAPNAGLKFAYIYQWMGTAGGADFASYEGNPFYLVRSSDSTVVYSSADYGKGLELRKKMQIENSGISTVGWNGSDIWECDFSDIGNSVSVPPGEYRLAVDGVGCSFPFRIDKDVYTDLSYLLVRGLYHQRSGPARTVEYTPFVKPVDHTPGVNGFEITYSTLTFSGDDALNFAQLPAKATDWVWPGNPYDHMLDEPDGWGWGGYFDAADYNRGRHHLQVSTDLMLVYEMNPGKFHDNELNIPESGNGLPDFLDEAEWGVDLFRRLKGPTGGICGGLETTGYYHPSWEDNHMWYAFAEEAITTWDFAGTAAQLAYCYELAGQDQASIDKWVKEATDAYAWADSASSGNEGRTYIEQKYYAAAALYRMTGDHKYLDDFVQCRSWYTDLNTSYGTYIFCLTPSDQWGNFTTEEKTLQSSLIATIHDLAYQQGIDQARERAMRFIKGSNPTLDWGGYYPHVMLQMVYQHLSGDEDVMDLLFTTADLYLGENNDQQVFITGAESVNADRVLRDILHIDSNYDGVPGWIPGIPPYKHTSTVYNASWFTEPSDPHAWPVMEQCNDARDYIPASEFTVNETIDPMASLFSYLKAASSGKQFIINVQIPEDSVFIPGSDVPVSVMASVSEGTISKVQLYSGSTIVGEDTLAPFEFTLDALPAGVYDISAKAWSEDENKKSKSVTVVVDDQPPTDPVNLHFTNVEALLIDLAWDASSDDAGVKDYEVFVNNELLKTSILPECTINGLTADTRYSIYIEAVDFAGTHSSPSNTVDTITKSGKFIPGLIQAEDYDGVVGEVASEASGDVDNTDYVGWFDEGESLEYAVSIEHTGGYLVTFRVARGIDPGEFDFLEGTTLLKSVYVPNTGGWGQWADVSDLVYLDAGQQSLIIENTGNPFNINWMNFEPAIATESVTIDNCPDDSIATGVEYNMTATVSPADASDTSVTWTSSDESVATVDSNGKVSAVSEGNVEISVKTNSGGNQDICSINVYRYNIGIQPSRLSDFTMYPNPAQDGKLTLKGEILKNSQVYLTDTDGRVIFKKINKGNSEMTINTGNLKAGIYIIRIVGTENTLTRKMIVN